MCISLYLWYHTVMVLAVSYSSRKFAFLRENCQSLTPCSIMAEKLKFNLNITFSEGTSDKENIFSGKPDFVLEIPQKILLGWHDLNAKGQGRRCRRSFLAMRRREF